MTRQGNVPLPEVRHVDDIPRLDSLQGLQQLSSTLPAELTEVQIKPPQMVSKTFASRKVPHLLCQILVWGGETMVYDILDVMRPFTQQFLFEPF